MKCIRVFLYIFLILIGLGATSGYSANEKTKISIPVDSWDFGHLDPEQKAGHIFLIENKGDAELLISSVSTTCKCTNAYFILKEHPLETATAVSIPVNGAAKLQVTVHLTEEMDLLKSYIMIASNDPEHPIRRIFVKAQTKVKPSSSNKTNKIN